jgi:sugar lactone lactonase YvrE
VGSRIHRFVPASGAHETWATPELPTSIGLAGDGGFIVGLRQRVVRWRPGGAFETFAVPEPDTPGNRLNEGVVAPDGSFWVGTMQENIGPDLAPKAMTENIGALYRIAPDGRVSELSTDRFGITNTMVWLDDGSFVTADTLRNELYRYDYDTGTQRLSNRRLFTTIERGLPDGSTRDAAGNVYNARVVGGAGIARITPTGEVAKVFDLPCQSPTSCAFGGPNLDTLYVTSARFGMSAEALKDNGTDGGLFALDVGAVGSPPNVFG